jgi:hypothetical protein
VAHAHADGLEPDGHAARLSEPGRTIELDESLQPAVGGVHHEQVAGARHEVDRVHVRALEADPRDIRAGGGRGEDDAGEAGDPE